MRPVHALVAYYAAPGSTNLMAARLARAARRAGAEVRLRDVESFSVARHDDPNGPWADVQWADVLLWGSPSRYGLVANRLEYFIEMYGPKWARDELSRKVFGGCTTSDPDGAELDAFDRMAERSVTIAGLMKRGSWPESRSETLDTLGL